MTKTKEIAQETSDMKFRVSADIRQQIEVIARRDGQSMSRVARQVLQVGLQYVNQEKAKQIAGRLTMNATKEEIPIANNLIFNGVQLIQDCCECNATGWVRHPAWLRYDAAVLSAQFSDPPETPPDYETWFYEKGYSIDEIPGEELPCLECAEGKELTSDGRVLATFIRLVVLHKDD